MYVVFMNQYVYLCRNKSIYLSSYLLVKKHSLILLKNDNIQNTFKLFKHFVTELVTPVPTSPATPQLKLTSPSHTQLLVLPRLQLLGVEALAHFLGNNTGQLNYHFQLGRFHQLLFQLALTSDFWEEAICICLLKIKASNDRPR